MGDIRQSMLRQQLQRELDIAKRLESEGKGKQASVHYVRAGSMYRRIAFNSPREKAEEMFSSAVKYESLGKTMGSTSPRERALSPEMIDSMVVSQKPDVSWEDIGGLKEAKKTIKEAIIIPFIKGRPSFVKAPRTILLYGPPGTGKTMLAKASSTTIDATFFEARASSLLSKYFGESTKLVNALFEKAQASQPALIFMDEIDSMAPSREARMDESTRRVLGQLLSEIEGFNTPKEERVLFMGATNKPWDLDDAMLSRFQRKVYVPLPDAKSREKIAEIHLKGAQLSGISLAELSGRSAGYSGRDIANVCQDAVIHMVREMNPGLDDMRPVEIERYVLKHRSLTPADFDVAFENIKPGIGEHDLKRFEDWKRDFGG